MGLFDKFKSENSNKHNNYEPLTDYEAWIGILYACISADGEVSDIEIDTLSRMITFKEKFSGIDIVPFYKNVYNANEEIGGNRLIEICSKKIKSNEKNTFFSMAVEIVLSDGILDESEEKIIEVLAHNLQIDSNLVDKIIEVMIIRNTGNVVVLE